MGDVYLNNPLRLPAQTDPDASEAIRRDWAEANIAGSGASDHITNLDADSRLLADDPTAYPLGFSEMPSLDTETVGTFAYASGDFANRCTVQTARFHDADVDADGATQLFIALDNDSLFTRYWAPVVSGGAWSDFTWINRGVTWSTLPGKPIAFPANQLTHLDNESYTNDLSGADISHTGLSYFHTDDQTTSGTIANALGDSGVVLSSGFYDAQADDYGTMQIFYGNTDPTVEYRRIWQAGAIAWSAWVAYYAIAGTPSEGDVVTWVSGVATWAAP